MPALATASRHRSLLLPLLQPPYAAARSPLSGSYHRPDSRGETERTQHGPNYGEGLGRGAPCLGREGCVLGLLGRLLDSPHGTLHFAQRWQALWKLEVCRRFDVIELPTSGTRIEGCIDRCLRQAPEETEAVLTRGGGDEIGRVVARIT